MPETTKVWLVGQRRNRNVDRYAFNRKDADYDAHVLGYDLWEEDMTPEQIETLKQTSEPCLGPHH